MWKVQSQWKSQEHVCRKSLLRLEKHMTEWDDLGVSKSIGKRREDNIAWRVTGKWNRII